MFCFCRASEELAEVEAELVGFTVSSLPACLVLSSSTPEPHIPSC